MTKEMARPWLTNYPAGVPAKIDESKVGTVVDILKHSAVAYPDRPAFDSFGVKLTFKQIADASAHITAYLQSIGMKKGDRIGLMLPNVMSFPVIAAGVLRGGFTCVNINPLYTVRELTHQLNDSGVRVLFVLENVATVPMEALPKTKVEKVVICSLGDLLGFKGAIVNLVARKVKKIVPAFNIPGSVTFKSVMAEGSRHTPVYPVVKEDDIAFLQYTGGTTGVSKGATLTHRNVAANIQQLEAWIGSALKVPNGDVAKMVTALPLYHIFALTCSVLMGRLGVTCLLITNPRDFAGFVKTLKTSGFTAFMGVNTLYNALANREDFAALDFSKLTFCIAGGMATQSAVAEKWKKVTGRTIVEAYGLSETSPGLTSNRTDIPAFTGHIGYPFPSTDCAIRDANGNDVPQGESGELCARGPQVMPGYWNRDDETAKVMYPDGFFRTGDIAIMLPDGAFKIVDRLKDMIIVSGFNVFPNEVEEALASHPGILEVAVIGVPDNDSGEAIMACVVKKDPNVTEAEIRDYARKTLTGYKIPRHVKFMDALPKTNVGKVLRRSLREEIIGKK